jgi:hypothetical protein
MENAISHEGLLATLTECYEAAPGKFVTLPKELLDSSSTRLALADLRNSGYIEEETRGVVRLTPLGYMLYRKHSRPVAGTSALRFAV